MIGCGLGFVREGGAQTTGVLVEAMATHARIVMLCCSGERSHRESGNMHSVVSESD